MAESLFLQYPKCSTCRNAKKWLEAQGAEFEDRNIALQPPTKEELRDVLNKSGLDIKKLFNTSGQKYRELGLKDKLKTMSEEEMLDLLSSDGMLVKRPIFVHGGKATVGFKEAEFERVLS